MSHGLDRRSFLKGALAGAGALCLPIRGAALPAEYRGPNVVIVRFGGGVRRRETIDPEHTYAPFLLHDLAPRGTLFSDMQIASEPGIETSHGQGTLNILIGRYAEYHDVEGRFLGDRFEAEHPTLFEYLRKAYGVLPHQALIVNGEDRTDEEFYAFSNHRAFGVRYRCNVLSLYRFKCYLLRRQIRSGDFADEELEKKRNEIARLEALDHRNLSTEGQGEVIEAFWERWRGHYGESGLVNPRGDRLLTELAIRAMQKLRPRLMMIHYSDPDYVHWGNATHYTRAISVIDEGLRRLVDHAAADPFYAGRTVFVIAPDCGRDDNRYMAVPFQHHFNSKSARQIFALLVGPGIGRGRVVDRPVEQIGLTATVGQIMGMKTAHADAPVLVDAFA